MNRRELFRLFAKAVLGLVGGFSAIALVLRCIRTCSVDRSPATVAARTANTALENHREGRETRRDAREAFERGDWRSAESLYRTAHNEYFLAWEKYRTAVGKAESANCEPLVEALTPYVAYCRHMEDACSNLSRAAELYRKGEDEKGDDYRMKGIELRRKATAVTDTPVPEPFDTDQPCKRSG